MPDHTPTPETSIPAANTASASASEPKVATTIPEPETPATPLATNSVTVSSAKPPTPATHKPTFELPQDWRRWAIIGGGAIAIFLVVVGATTAWQMRGTSTTEPSPTPIKKKKLTEVLNAIPLTERPSLKITPGGSGTNITIGLEELKKPAQEAEYEIEYQAGSLVKGAFGTLNIANLPTVADVLLGSCSTGGKCTYDTDVKGGSLLLRFKGSENYSLKSNWVYLDNAKRSKLHVFTQPKASDEGSSSLTTTGTGESSADQEEIFSIEAASLSQQRFIILYQTPGFPKSISGEVIGSPIAVSGVTALSGTAKVTFTLPEGTTGTKIMAWDGSKWNELKSSVTGQKITAEGPAASVYVVVK